MEDVIEKPTPTEAEQRLLVPGLRAGHYLCFFGMHVLTPAIFGWVDGIIQFNGTEWVRMDPTFAAAGNTRSMNEYIGDGSHYTDLFFY